MEQKRIEYIDLMKGLCILFVIFNHCVHTIYPQQLNYLLRNIALSAFFISAGFFIDTPRSFAQFTIKKFNRLLIPFLFFNTLWLIPVAIFPLEPVFTFSLPYFADFYLDPANISTWFLPPLFFLYILYFGINRLPARIQPIAIIIIVILGWHLIYNYRWTHCYFWHELMRFHIPISMISLPLIYVGHRAARLRLLTWNPSPTISVIIAVIAFVVSYICSAQDVNIYYITFDNSPLLFYCAAFAGTVWLWILAKKLHRIPMISYIGRYSIIALGIHSPIIDILFAIGIENPYLRFFITTAGTIAMIQPIKKLFPAFTAQRDLLVFDKSQKINIRLNLSRKRTKKFV